MTELPATTNPFSTRWTRPGALAYRFAEGDSSASVIERLAANGWRGAIIGPHGSGKSTLLATLEPALSQHGRTPLTVVLHQGQHTLDWSRLAKELRPETVLIVDGYEQLRPWNRWRLDQLVGHAGCGLIVTTHRRVRLPMLVETAVDRSIARALVAELLTRGSAPLPPAEIDAALDHHPDNLREALFELYDVYEQRRLRLPPVDTAPRA